MGELAEDSRFNMGKDIFSKMELIECHVQDRRYIVFELFSKREIERQFTLQIGLNPLTQFPEIYSFSL